MRKFKEIIYNYWKIFLLIFVCLLFLGGVLYYYYFYDDKNKNEEDVVVNEPVFLEEVKDNSEVVDDNVYVFVDVKGEVVNPGMYKIILGSRVLDAINMAGGLTNIADTRVNNLSMKVFDEMVIIVYSHDDVINFADTLKKEEVITSICSDNEGVMNSSCIDDVSSTNNLETKININTADESKLVLIPGIGDAKASAIVDYRKSNLFVDISDIKNVTGIGDDLYEQIKDYITI